MNTTNLKTVRSCTRMLRISPRKLNLVAKMVRNMNPMQAMLQMQFSKKKASEHVLHSIKTAVANAENNHNMRIKNLVITSATVGKARCMRRFRPRAKGRSTRINKLFSNLYISLSIPGDVTVAEQKDNKIQA